MGYTVTIDIIHALWVAFFGAVWYVYIKDNSDDHLTQKRHNVEMKKEWFRMLAEQNKEKAKRYNRRA